MPTNYSIDQLQNTGSFVPTTNVWDVAEIYELKDVSEDFRELLVRLYQNLNLMSEVLNTKDSAYYITDQFISSQLYFNPTSTNQQDLRPGYREVVNTGALGAGVTTVAHNLPFVAGWQFFFINGAATDSGTVTAVPLPFAGSAGNNIQVTVTSTSVVINNQSGLTFDSSAVILEYVKV
jgi:hypothetical protein